MAARKLEGECLLATAAFTCINSTFQYPRGSAQAGRGWLGALATAALAFFSATFSAWGSPDFPATLTAWRASVIPFPWPFFQASYWCLQLTGTETVLWLACGAVGAAVLLHAVSPMTAAPAAARAIRFNSISVRGTADHDGEYTRSTQ